MIKLLSAAVLAQVLLGSWAASAQEAIPLTLGLVDDGPVNGQPGFAGGTTHGDGTWVTFAVSLQQGKDYFLAGVSESESHLMELRDAGGRVFKRGYAQEDGLNGFEFRPPTTATYFLRFIQEGLPVPREEEVGAYAGPDCRGGTNTKCTLNIGKSFRGRWDFLTEGDLEQGPGKSEFDFYRVRLERGRTYTATLVWGADPMCVSFFDANRRELSGSSIVRQGATGFFVRTTFRPTQTGNYWVCAAGSSDNTYYNITVK